MTTSELLKELEEHPERTFANVNPHWWIGKNDKGIWVDYSYGNDDDCDCYQRDYYQTKDEILRNFTTDEWERST